MFKPTKEFWTFSRPSGFLLVMLFVLPKTMAHHGTSLMYFYVAFGGLFFLHGIHAWGFSRMEAVFGRVPLQERLKETLGPRIWWMRDMSQTWLMPVAWVCVLGKVSHGVLSTQFAWLNFGEGVFSVGFVLLVFALHLLGLGKRKLPISLVCIGLVSILAFAVLENLLEHGLAPDLPIPWVPYQWSLRNLDDLIRFTLFFSIATGLNWPLHRDHRVGFGRRWLDIGFFLIGFLTMLQALLPNGVSSVSAPMLSLVSWQLGVMQAHIAGALAVLMFCLLATRLFPCREKVAALLEPYFRKSQPNHAWYWVLGLALLAALLTSIKLLIFILAFGQVLVLVVEGLALVRHPTGWSGLKRLVFGIQALGWLSLCLLAIEAEPLVALIWFTLSLVMALVWEFQGYRRLPRQP